MKKHLFGIIALLVLVIACSKEEEPTPDPTPKFILSISAEEGGSVSTSGGTYDKGAKVTVTATAQGEFLFESWSDGSTDNPREIIVTSNLSLSARFVKKKYTLTISIEGEGTVLEEMVVQGSASSTEYNSGATVRVEALPEEGWVFHRWSGDIDATENPTTISLTTNKSINAHFLSTQAGFAFEISGEGTVSVKEIGSGRYQLVAEPAPGWLLEHWIGSFGTIRQSVLLKEYGDNEMIQVVFREVGSTDSVFGTEEIASFYNSLQLLSSGWDGAEVSKANEFLNRFSGVAVDYWILLFEKYFNEHPFTSDLWNYLGYPAYYWFGSEVNLKIQASIYPVILKKLVLLELESQSGRHQSFEILRALGDYLIAVRDNNHKLSPDFLLDSNYYLQAFVQSHGSLFNYHVTLTSQQIADYGDIKAQLYFDLSGFFYFLNTPSSELIDLIAINPSSIEYQIFDQHKVLVYHNSYFTTHSLSLIKDVFELVPGNYHRVIGMTQQGTISNPHRFRSIGGFNVFELNTGTHVENGFPEEVNPFYSDLFYIVLVHEFTHNVDSHFISNHSILNNHRDLLIEMAGIDRSNYLRSVIDSGYFVSNPQEFIASIANMYLTNTALTFEVALERAKSQNFHPLNQFLLFARVFGTEDFVNFYTYGENGPLTIESIPFQRNESGFVTSFVLDAKEYRFVLNNENMVVDLQILEP